MGIEQSKFFQWFSDSENPTFFNEENELLTPTLYGFIMTLFSLLMYWPLLYRLIKIICLPKTVRPKQISWLFITRILSMLIIFICCLIRSVVPLCFSFMKTTIYNEQYVDENEGFAYYLILPNFLLCLD